MGGGGGGGEWGRGGWGETWGCDAVLSKGSASPTRNSEAGMAL